MHDRNNALHPSSGESAFIAAARLLMICGLVYHHLFEIPGSSQSPRLNLEGAGHFMPEFINGFFHMMFMAAVPILSIISGYLLFRRPRIDFRRELGKRFFTVALPSWLWCALWLALAWSLYQAGVTGGAFAWTAYSFEDGGALTLLNGVVGVTRQPLAFQFWFVHDLILTLLLSPLIWFCLRRLGTLVLLAGFPLWFILPAAPPFFSTNVPMFFTLGAWLALPGAPGLEGAAQALRRHAWPIAALFLLGLLARQLSHLGGVSAEAVLMSEAWLKLLRVLGVLTFSQLIFALTARPNFLASLLRRYSGYSFFIFAAHFPLIEFYQAAALRLPGHDTSAGLLLSWLLIPLLTIITLVAAARTLERRLPAAFSLLNGGRGAAPQHGQAGARGPLPGRPRLGTARG